ncbi:Hypothetical protein LUCI_4815 [Lucifera butyrica]|uniref:Uncharacterized protein n=1 Tax=Lucifera butyrica TaxID=1351585 RepID=A0A498RFD3_9FIRM|nr:DsrE family protein [Lucifera butyrica]VBB09520.1 Hypothetical protein LUCI_4815 [Lucifera butyrica]
MNQEVQPGDSNELYVLWTTGDRETALSMVFMYTLNAKLKGWWEDVTLIIWGASTKLLARDEELQGRIRQMIDAGVDVVACVACANMFGATKILEDLGIEVKGMGHPLTQLLKAGKTVLSV